MLDENKYWPFEKRGQANNTPASDPEPHLWLRYADETATPLYAHLMDVDVEGGEITLQHDGTGDYQAHDLAAVLTGRKRELDEPSGPVEGVGGTYLFTGSVRKDGKGIVTRSTIETTAPELEFDIPELKGIEVLKGPESDPLHELSEIRRQEREDLKKDGLEKPGYPDNEYVKKEDRFSKLKVPELRQLLKERRVRSSGRSKQQMVDALVANDNVPAEPSQEESAQQTTEALLAPYNTSLLTADKMNADLAASLDCAHPATHDDGDSLPPTAPSSPLGNEATDTMTTGSASESSLTVPQNPHPVPTWKASAASHPNPPRSPSEPDFEPLTPHQEANTSPLGSKQGRKRGTVATAEGESNHGMATRSKKPRTE